jgi:predicted TIM-barrel fold metal-dependent hydrolase
MRKMQAIGPDSGQLIVDCDVHHGLSALTDLSPYLGRAWRARLGFGSGEAAGLPSKASFTLPWGHFANPHGGMRMDAMPPNGGPAASDPDFTARQLFDGHAVSYAILMSGDMICLGGLGFPDLAANLASAVNQWTIERWLEHDERYLGSVVVAPQDPHAAAREIRRSGAHPRMVQVQISSTRAGRLGHRMHHPIYEAAAEMSLPVSWHLGAEISGVNGSLTAGAPPTSYVEAQTSYPQTAQAELISMICEGVFEKFPELKFVVTEGGVAWLPHVMWRLDRTWRVARDELPWVKRPPSEYIRDHVRLTTQPLEEPTNRKAIVTLLSTIDAEDLLLFATDYPHYDFDNPTTTLSAFSEEARRKMFSENALSFYPRLADIVQRPVALV